MHLDLDIPSPLPPGVPPEAVPFLQGVGYFTPDTLCPGGLAPDVPLFTPSGETVPMRRLRNERPAALIFGSYT